MNDELLRYLMACEGFDWDDGNFLKNWRKHTVTPWECEQVFFNSPLLAFNDVSHSRNEPRIFVLGRTDGARRLFIAATLRNRTIRVISARDMSRKEREVYERQGQTPR
jgi:uncharacterized DUF497 family protein